MDLNEIRAAVQYQIDTLVVNPTFAFRPTLATPADAPEILALATTWTAGRPLCGWDALLADPPRLATLLNRWLALNVRHKTTGALVAFSGGIMRDPPEYEVGALMAVGTALNQWRAHAVRGVVVFRALIPMGYTTLVIPQIPSSVKWVADALTTRLPEMKLTRIGTNLSDGLAVNSLRIDIRRALDRLEKVII